MYNDRSIREENSQLLMGRWALLRSSPSRTEAARLGMAEILASTLKELDEIQVRRAGDCALPLFSLSLHEDEIKSALLAGQDQGIAPFDDTDRLVENENFTVLLNRWGAVRSSPIYAQCTFGLSFKVIGLLEQATLDDLKRASKKGFRMVALGVRPKYLFHAGRNIGLQRSMRAALAVCTSTSTSSF